MEKRLKQYSLLASTLPVSSIMEAQVSCTNVDPDVTITLGESYSIDMDGDGNNDFKLEVVTSAFTGSQAQLTSTGLYANGFVRANIGKVAQLSSGATISSGNTFSYFAFGGLLCQELFTDGYWCNSDVRYIGVNFTISGNTHYGWIKCSCASDGSSITIYSYAYEQVADASIDAGEGDCEDSTVQERPKNAIINGGS